RVLTVELNGHVRDVTKDRKASYFDDDGGLCGRRRRARRRVLAPQERGDLDRLMRLRPHADTDANGLETAIGGRVTRWSEGHGAGDGHQAWRTADESKRFDLDAHAA